MLPDEKSQPDSQAISDEKKIDSKVHLTTSKKIIFWAYLFTILLFAIVLTVLLGLGWQLIRDFRQSDNFYYANQVTYQWKLGFITDMIITEESTCPSQFEHAFSYKWDGTKFGCFCQPDVNVSFVLSGYCTPTLIQENCRNIESQSEFSTHYWRNATNFCIKRSQTSFATENKYDGDNKLCGSSNSLVIMPSNEPCPIVNITLNYTGLELNQEIISDVDGVYDKILYKIINATSPYSFYSYPVSQFSVSEYQFCLINEDTGIYADHRDFILLMEERGCAQSGNYTTLDTMTEVQFYANNPKLSRLQSLNGFPPANLWEYKLGYNAIPSWKYQCRHNMDRKFDISKSSEQFNFSFYDNFQGISIAMIILLAIIYGECFVLVIRRLYHRQIYPVGYKQLYLPFDFARAISRYIIDFIAKLAIFGMVFYLSWASIYNWSWFKSAINQDCAESNPQLATYVLTPYSQLYVGIIQYSIGQFVLCILFFVLDIIHFVHIYNNELKFYLVNTQGKAMVFNSVGMEESPNFNPDNEADLDFIKDPKWMKINDKGSERDKREVMDDLRVTMAINWNQGNYNESIALIDEEDIAKKPKIKKKKKPMRGLFQRMEAAQLNDNQNERDKKKREDIDSIIMRESNPYMLEQQADIHNSVQQINVGSKIERKRRRFNEDTG